VVLLSFFFYHERMTPLVNYPLLLISSCKVEVFAESFISYFSFWSGEFFPPDFRTSEPLPFFFLLCRLGSSAWRFSIFPSITPLSPLLFLEEPFPVCLLEGPRFFPKSGFLSVLSLCPCAILLRYRASLFRPRASGLSFSVPTLCPSFSEALSLFPFVILCFAFFTIPLLPSAQASFSRLCKCLHILFLPWTFARSGPFFRLRKFSCILTPNLSS